MKNRKKIFVMVLPFLGHINPLTGLAKELVLKQKYDVFFFGNPEHKILIEKTGSIFREYLPLSKLKSKPLNEDKNDAMESFFSKMLDYSYTAVPALIKELESDQPDLLIYDHLFIPVRLALRVMEARFKNGLTNYKPPQVINFYSCFVSKRGIYPSNELLKKFQNNRLRYIITFLKLILKQTLFSLNFGIDIYNPIELTLTCSDELNIVSVFPEFHPNSRLYDEKFKFVGPCISEAIRKSKNLEPNMARVLNLFEPINPNFTYIYNKSNIKLVFASLGTVFNNNIFIYDSIIESIRLYEERMNKKSIELRVVVSVGQNNKKIYDDKILNGILKISKNILLMESVPQVDILERASVFITHCGMNSVSESIHYGVPMICLPIKADQPFVAHRLCDELDLGIRLDPLNTKPSDITAAIETILTDNSYLDRMLCFTRICRKYNGSKISANLVEDFIQKKLH